MYEMVYPLFQELCEVYEGASPATKNRVCGELKRLVHEGRRKRALGNWMVVRVARTCLARWLGKMPPESDT